MTQRDIKCKHAKHDNGGYELNDCYRCESKEALTIYHNSNNSTSLFCPFFNDSQAKLFCKFYNKSISCEYPSKQKTTTYGTIPFEEWYKLISESRKII